MTMGSRGAFLDKGFSVYKWKTEGYIDGFRILVPIDSRASLNLPERANTPGTTYVSYSKDGTFKQLITFDENRMPIYEIDYGRHDNVTSLHFHRYDDGDREKKVHYLHEGDALYEKYKNIFKGVKL